MRTLTIDPSGTGTSGICFITEEDIEFVEIKHSDWKEHLRLLIAYIRKELPIEEIIYEHTNYIHKRTKDGLSLFQLLGAIEGLSYTFPTIQTIHSISVIQVKELYQRIYQGKEQINGLTYKIGRGGGWHYHQQKISRHQLDAWLLFHLGKRK